MRLTLTTRLVARSVPEGSAFDVAVRCYSDAAEPWTLSAPTTLRYRVDRDDGSAVVDWTTLTPATTATATITGANNTLTDSCSPRERRRITVQANAGIANAAVESIEYYVTGNGVA